MNPLSECEVNYKQKIRTKQQTFEQNIYDIVETTKQKNNIRAVSVQ